MCSNELFVIIGRDARFARLGTIGFIVLAIDNNSIPPSLIGRGGARKAGDGEV